MEDAVARAEPAARATRPSASPLTGCPRLRLRLRLRCLSFSPPASSSSLLSPSAAPQRPPSPARSPRPRREQRPRLLPPPVRERAAEVGRLVADQRRQAARGVAPAARGCRRRGVDRRAEAERPHAGRFRGAQLWNHGRRARGEGGKEERRRRAREARPTAAAAEQGRVRAGDAPAWDDADGDGADDEPVATGDAAGSGRTRRSHPQPCYHDHHHYARRRTTRRTRRRGRRRSRRTQPRASGTPCRLRTGMATNGAGGRPYRWRARWRAAGAAHPATRSARRPPCREGR